MAGSRQLVRIKLWQSEIRCEQLPWENPANTFTITATPTNGFAEPTCGNLTVTSNGTRSSSAGDVRHLLEIGFI